MSRAHVRSGRRFGNGLSALPGSMYLPSAPRGVVARAAFAASGVHNIQSGILSPLVPEAGACMARTPSPPPAAVFDVASSSWLTAAASFDLSAAAV